jgi:hypothetical protein
MANIINFSVTACTDNKKFTLVVDDPLSGITLNGTYYFESLGGELQSGCYTVVGRIVPSLDPVNMILGDTYTGCLDCLTDSSQYVLVAFCPPSKNSNLFPLPISAFTGTLDVGQTYYISFIYIGGNPITWCFNIKSFLTEYDGDVGQVISISPLEDSCQTCITENSFVYEVIDCLDEFTKYIQLPSDDYVGNLITYYDPSLLQQFCGVVGNIIDTIPDVTLVADLGPYIDPSQCEECLGQVADKRIITNCINGTESVVWASTLLGSEDFSNLSYELGCYDIGDLTESGVTITSFLNFDPQPSCTDCIECTGIQYNYSTCSGLGPIGGFSYSDTTISVLTDGTYYVTGNTDGSGQYALFQVIVESNAINSIGLPNLGILYDVGDTITLLGSEIGGISPDDDIIITVQDVVNEGSIVSYQYVENPIGTTLYIPWLDDCVEITSYSNPIGGYQIYSFNSLIDCETCDFSDNFVWLGESCSDGSQAIITTTNGFTLGDIVKVNRGSVEFDCYTLVSPYDASMGIYDTYNSLTNNAYQTCGECTLNSRINISIAECDGSNQQYVSISLDDWFTFTNFGYTTFNINEYDKCYVVINTCPTNGDYPEINIRSFYFNCDDCVFDNTRQPRNAGAEVDICIPLCDGSVVSVNPPHPEWTDGYGTQVTQLNMITLGGPNGLNN